jgi:hypothetical protein
VNEAKRRFIEMLSGSNMKRVIGAMHAVYLTGGTFRFPVGNQIYFINFEVPDICVRK